MALTPQSVVMATSPMIDLMVFHFDWFGFVVLIWVALIDMKIKKIAPIGHERCKTGFIRVHIRQRLLGVVAGNRGNWRPG